MFNLHFPFVIAVYFRPFHTTLNIKVFVFIFHVTFGLTLSTGESGRLFLVESGEKVKGNLVWSGESEANLMSWQLLMNLMRSFGVSTGIIYYLNGWQSR